MKIVDQSTSVRAYFKEDKSVHPQRFTWEGRWLSVSDIGRQWVDDAGRHVLVMVAGQRTFELLLTRQNLTWRVVRVPENLFA